MDDLVEDKTNKSIKAYHNSTHHNKVLIMDTWMILFNTCTLAYHTSKHTTNPSMTTSYQHLPTWKQPLACSKSITTSYYNITVKQIGRPNLSTWTDLARTRREEVVIELTDVIETTAEEVPGMSERSRSQPAPAVNRSPE